MPDITPIITVAPNQYQTMLDNYALIVEKTNSQLNSGINLSTLAVTILAAIIAVLAIFVAWAIWKNSKEQKDSAKQFFIEQDKIIKQKNKNIEGIESKLQNLINEYEKQLKETGKKNKKQIQMAIEDLKKEKASIGAYIGPTYALPTDSIFTSKLGQASMLSSFARSMICSSCGKSFDYYDNYSLGTVPNSIIFDSNTVYCTHCGKANKKQ